ncbi:MAG: energy transducer TonB [Prevotellaceae bacterium]|nr:energy transducer TonB [Candidatus Colivivens equi]
MEIKKSKKADLEGQKGTSLLLGYVAALAALFVCFEYTTREYAEAETPMYVPYAAMDEEVPPVTQPIFTVAPPPPAEVPQVPEILEIVDNDEEIEEEEIQSSEATESAISGPTAPVQGAVYVADGPVTPVVIQEDNDEDDVFQVVEEMPEFPGGMEALLAYLGKNTKYPSIAQENNIQGRVIVEFIVNKDGSIVEPKIIKSLDASCDKEALRVVKTLPKWKPGKQRGKPVRVKFTLPVMFRLT